MLQKRRGKNKTKLLWDYLITCSHETNLSFTWGSVCTISIISHLLKCCNSSYPSKHLLKYNEGQCSVCWVGISSLLLKRSLKFIHYTFHHYQEQSAVMSNQRTWERALCNLRNNHTHINYILACRHFIVLLRALPKK